jgi:type III secretory pathway component EscR
MIKSPVISIISGICAAFFIGFMIYVCFLRIREIKEEDPDDISKY